jgi:hypothetical protein
MAPRQMHLHGAPADHALWLPGPTDDDFDESALEKAMIEAREKAYRALASLDAA